MIEFFGIMGGALGVVIFIPQLIKSVRTKSTKDLSWWTYILITSNVIMWALYGIFKSDPFISVPNIIGTLLSLIMLTLKSRYG